MCVQRKLGKRKLYMKAVETFPDINFPKRSDCSYFCSCNDDFELLLLFDEYIVGIYRRVLLLRNVDTGSWYREID